MSSASATWIASAAVMLWRYFQAARISGRRSIRPACSLDLVGSEKEAETRYLL
jgi:hypothetical protein